MNRFTEKFKNLKCLTHFLLPITKCNFRKSKQPELGKSWFWTHILSIMRVFLKKWVLPLSCINWTRTLSEKSKKCNRTILRKCCYRWTKRENWIHRTFWQSQWLVFSWNYQSWSIPHFECNINPKQSLLTSHQCL